MRVFTIGASIIFLIGLITLVAPLLGCARQQAEEDDPGWRMNPYVAGYLMNHSLWQPVQQPAPFGAYEPYGYPFRCTTLGAFTNCQ